MNITMNIECSPEEARRLMGLPDLTGIHEVYLEKVKELMANGIGPDMVDQMMRNWSPMGEMGLGAWKQMLDTMTFSAAPKG